jgi:hypothetical protein
VANPGHHRPPSVRGAPPIDASPHSHLGGYTHIPVLFGSLIVSNLLQSIGTIVDARWVFLSKVAPGTLCRLQGVSIPTSPNHAPVDSWLSIP